MLNLFGWLRDRLEFEIKNVEDSCGDLETYLRGKVSAFHEVLTLLETHREEEVEDNNEKTVETVDDGNPQGDRPVGEVGVCNADCHCADASKCLPDPDDTSSV